jgi:hypothetical protein
LGLGNRTVIFHIYNQHFPKLVHSEELFTRWKVCIVARPLQSCETISSKKFICQNILILYCKVFFHYVGFFLSIKRNFFWTTNPPFYFLTSPLYKKVLYNKVF